MSIDPRIADLIREFEGCRLDAYQDVAGIWTIGWGSTLGVKPGDRITQEQADALLLAEIARKQMGLKDMVKVPLSNGEMAAYTSLAFNIGLGAVKGSTLLSDLNGGDRIGALAEFARWHRAGGKRQKGLLKRRAKEILIGLEDL